jgi:tRNA(Arg) A34 adenosine deaminase TadA
MPIAAMPATDRRFMAAAIRFSRRHHGLTGTNPSVASLIVRDDGAGPYIVGCAVTAIGGRPHAEPQALAEAGELARGATAYVTLEPCAMCAAAISFARLRRLYFGAEDVKAGGVVNGPRFFTQPTCHHAPETYPGIGETRSAELLKRFFRDRR